MTNWRIRTACLLLALQCAAMGHLLVRVIWLGDFTFGLDNIVAVVPAASLLLALWKQP